MSDRVRLICIILTILCIFAVLAEKCKADSFDDRVQSLINDAWAEAARCGPPRTNYGDTYIGSSYSAQGQDRNVNINVNRNTVIVQTPEPYFYYYYPANDSLLYWQHFNEVNRNRR